MHTKPFWVKLALWASAAHVSAVGTVRSLRAACDPGNQETPHISRSEWSASLQCRALCWGPRLPPVLMIPKASHTVSSSPGLLGMRYC